MSERLQEFCRQYKESMVQLERYYNDTKAQLKSNLIDTLRNGGDELDNNFLNFYYWETDLDLRFICDAMGIKKSEFEKKVDRFRDFVYACERCGGRVVLEFKNRTEKQKVKTVLCTKCEHDIAYEKMLISKFGKDLAHAKLEMERLKEMPYNEYLKTPHWQQMRERALKRAGYRCALCNSKGKLDVHHRTYERRGEEWDRDLVVLCRGCHQKFHDKLPK